MCAGGAPTDGSARLCVVSLEVGGKKARALIDSGCTDTVVAPWLVEGGYSLSACGPVRIMDGSLARVQGRGKIKVNVESE